MIVCVDEPGHTLTFIDLFAGCGGFSLGLEQAGMRCLAAIDFDEPAIETFRRNHPAVKHVLVRDLTRFRPEQLDALLGSQRVDVIVGGPPCQGFSKARQVDGANHGHRLVDDPRRSLYRQFLTFVKYYQPKAFVMENVPGLRSAAGGEFFTKVQVESRKLGYRVVPFEAKSWSFGVPQKRIRQLFIGTRRELPLFIADRYIRPTHGGIGEPSREGLEPVVTVGEAIGDLPPIDAGDDEFERVYDLKLRKAHLAKYGKRYLYDVLQVDRADKLTALVSRPHSQRDLRDFARLREGENSRQAIARGEEMEFPYDRSHFKDRYTRQHRDGLCSTIVAHLKKDGLMFIHPTQPRSLTPREAARIQSFPDTFELPRRATNSFAQIGNAVPPLVGKAVGGAIRAYLADALGEAKGALESPGELPAHRDEAISILESFVESLFLRPIGELSKQEFLKAWWAVGFLHPNLHPDTAFDNGRDLSKGPRRGISFVVEPVYVRSGWPVELMPIAHEARRRFDAGALAEDEYYCSAAVVAGASSHEH